MIHIVIYGDQSGSRTSCTSVSRTDMLLYYIVIHLVTSVVSRYSTVLGDEDFQLRLPLRDLVLPLFEAYFYLLIYYTTEFPEVPPNLFCNV